MMHKTFSRLAISALLAGSLGAGLLAGCSGRTQAGGDGSEAAGEPVVLPASVASDWAGKVVVADFWATWCGPCRASSPNVQILHETFAADDGVLVVGVHSDDSVEDPGAYMTEHEYTYGLVAKGQEVSDVFGVHALPTFVVLDAEGREVYRSVGMMTEKTRREIEQVVRGLRG